MVRQSLKVGYDGAGQNRRWLPIQDAAFRLAVLDGSDALKLAVGLFG